MTRTTPQTAERLSDAEWSIIASAIPGFSNLVHRERAESNLQVIEVGAGTTLPAEGMYIVLGGTTSLLLNGNEIAVAEAADYFYEEHLVIDDLAVELVACTSTPTKLVLLSKSNWATLSSSLQDECLQMLFGDLVNVHLHEFQQPINCCNITAAALGITALGFSCDVNDIFQRCSLPVSYVVDDGMTIGELYDVASSYVYTKGLRDKIGVELYYFDRDVITRQDLFDAIAESNRVGGDSDILVANFGVGIAHGRPDLPGGHFAVIAKCNQSTGLVHMMDVHPAKYGKIWVTSVDRLFDAMADADDSARRARGLIRFIVKQDIDVRLDTLAKSDCYPVNCTMYLDLTPEKRRHIFSRSSVNMNSLHVLSMALGILDNHPVEVDEILEAAQLSYTDALSVQPTPVQLAAVAGDYLTHTALPDIRCTCHSCADEDAIAPEAWFKTQLLTVASNPDACFMINIDYNEVVGFEAIQERTTQYQETDPFKEFWCVVIDYQYETDAVILADMSPATSQIWRAPRTKVFRGLRNTDALSVLYLEKVESERNDWDFTHLIADHRFALFHGDDAESGVLQDLFANIGATDLFSMSVSGFGMNMMGIRKKLALHSDKDHAPWVYLDGESLGNVEDILAMVRNGSLQQRLRREGLAILTPEETPNLKYNVFSYPRGGAGIPRAERGHNVLLGACGSPGAEGVPALLAALTTNGHNVRLLPTATAERFFGEFGMDEIRRHIRDSDIFRDEDDWRFRYIEQGMPIRAAHHALCDWADCIVVAPITLNTLGKLAHGVTDNLLSAVLGNWNFDKPAILCPACDDPAWNRLTTSSNLELVMKMGAEVQGPRSMPLANGRAATGLMASANEILSAFESAMAAEGDGTQRALQWARAAASSRDSRAWIRVREILEERSIDIDARDTGGDTLLHFAAGGEGWMSATRVERGNPDIETMQWLIECGCDVDAKNQYGFTPLHVAVGNHSLAAVRVLLAAGADRGACRDLIERLDDLPEEIRTALGDIDRKPDTASV